MKPFEVVWRRVHDVQVRNLDKAVAQAICTAVYAAAADGSGDIRRTRADTPDWISINVRGAVAYAYVDRAAHKLIVLNVVRAR
ncbi:hypothetical protein [Polyangium spumosum]|uniref:Type II toxin-antitoxin system RelE/ParE family toxin n=1 Tax=Polyangium spumosum TaxID=889282 RepID=A0A6N7PQL4_9BACT|nr:hypothetical protein [Polyangium spumosum]MRG92394.1 hypothetical protein [Polyangium spumosum]